MKEQVRTRAAKLRNDLLDQLFALPVALSGARAVPLDLHPVRSGTKVSQYISASVLDETSGIEIYEVERETSIGMTPLFGAVQNVINNLRRAQQQEQWDQVAALLSEQAPEALQSLQMLDALLAQLPEDIEPPLIQVWPDGDDTILCVRVNHGDGMSASLGASLPIGDGDLVFVGAEVPRHPGSWYSPPDDIAQELLRV